MPDADRAACGRRDERDAIRAAAADRPRRRARDGDSATPPGACSIIASRHPTRGPQLLARFEQVAARLGLERTTDTGADAPSSPAAVGFAWPSA